MTVLSVAQQVASVVGVPRPTVLFNSSNKTDIALREIANRAKDYIILDADWQILQGIHTITGDGSTEDWDLPTDFKRMLKDADVWSSALSTPLRHVMGLNEWLGLEVQSVSLLIDTWIIYGGEIHIKAALATDVTAKFAYIKDEAVRSDGGSNKANFTADDDVFRVTVDNDDSHDERLLELAMIWMWRSDKRLDYAQNFSDYLNYKNGLYLNDRGPRIVSVGRVRAPRDVEFAYPRALGS